MIDDSTAMLPTQASQDAEYAFPYHYVTSMPERGFAQHFVDAWGINYVSAMELVLAELSALQPHSVVDIGCGDGRLTREIHLRFGAARVLGADYSERAIALAKAMNMDRPGLRYQTLDITQVSFDEPFDAAVLMEVYEHIPLDRTSSFLAGVRRALKPGGTLLLTVPHANKPVEYKHFQHFTVDALVKDLEPHFEIGRVMPFERRSPLRGWLNRLLCNRLFVLNHPGLLAWAYRLHQRYLFECQDERSCQRIFVRAQARP